MVAGPSDAQTADVSTADLMRRQIIAQHCRPASMSRALELLEEARRNKVVLDISRIRGLMLVCIVSCTFLDNVVIQYPPSCICAGRSQAARQRGHRWHEGAGGRAELHA